ncbi:GNAT family N-acetyltransferase [Oceanicoccus sagamiensis]|uniref:N-acetyltransferase domain-containing protein n=1 Tax=Oceanicoccus sagamiensis TaxID=716816 RepID=A0A1X9N877_9GAMM|nr:GNAT family N-acetyltransferase [Oceanicoccus sagamiensis]ARN73361.1 hypothetical protein BST96_04100 [Oceanicoccus sagamiensis]
MIQVFKQSMEKQVIDHILTIENHEFHCNLTLEDQPDLLNIQESYIDNGGMFWVATDHDQIIGTLGLYNLGNGNCDLRKIFVHRDHRGGSSSIAQQMLNRFEQWAASHGFSTIYLETNSIFASAISFYSRNGFNKITPEQLPDGFPKIKVAEYFFHKKISLSPA